MGEERAGIPVLIGRFRQLPKAFGKRTRSRKIKGRGRGARLVPAETSQRPKRYYYLKGKRGSAGSR